MPRILNTPFGPLNTRMEQLSLFEAGDCFVAGPHMRDVFRVTEDCRTHPEGLVLTEMLTAAPGEDPEVVWTRVTKFVDYVVSGLSE